MVLPKIDEECEQCEEPGIAFNEDGDWLCEECLFIDSISETENFL